ncbi:MAG: hypothetical protein AAF772_00990 [Acidobacteriota bacterium]
MSCAGSCFRVFIADLVHLVDPAMAATLDFSELTFEKLQLAAGLGLPHASEVDLLVRAPLRDPPTDTDDDDPASSEHLTLVHVEIESRFRSAMDARMVRYACQIASQYARPVFPLVVFLAGGKTDLKLRTGVEHNGAFVFLEAHYLAFCLARCDPADYLARDRPLAWALSPLMRRNAGDRVAQKLAALRRPAPPCAALRRIAAANAAQSLTTEQRYLLTQTVDSYPALHGAEAERYAEQIEQQPEEIRDMIPRTYEQVFEEGQQAGHQLGVQEGPQLGVQEGRQLGVQEGRKAMLVRMIEQRFGTMDDAARARLDAIEDPDALDRLAARLFEVSSVEMLLEA